jgi:hypothetical protein
MPGQHVNNESGGLSRYWVSSTSYVAHEEE